MPVVKPEKWQPQQYVNIDETCNLGKMDIYLVTRTGFSTKHNSLLQGPWIRLCQGDIDAISVQREETKLQKMNTSAQEP